MYLSDYEHKNHIPYCKLDIWSLISSIYKLSKLTLTVNFRPFFGRLVTNDLIGSFNAIFKRQPPVNLNWRSHLEGATGVTGSFGEELAKTFGPWPINHLLGLTLYNGSSFIVQISIVCVSWHLLRRCRIEQNMDSDFIEQNRICGAPKRAYIDSIFMTTIYMLLCIVTLYLLL